VSSPSEVLVGRAAELDGLLLDLDAARAGDGRLVVLWGAAGIGKTALAQGLAAAAAGLEVPVARSRCLDDDGAPPLWPWTQALARVGVESPSPVAHGGTGADTAAARFLLVDRLATGLRQAAEPDGMVVVLEDLQWADEASLKVLRHVAGEVMGSHLLVIVTARVPTPEPVAAAVDDALREPGCRAATLGPLSTAAVAEYLQSCIGAMPPAALVSQVHRKTGGSPLLVRAVASALTGDMPGDLAAEGVWDRVARASDIGRLAGGMLATLPAEHRPVVEVAAVLGELVDPQVLGEVSGSDQAPAALQAAATAGLLVSEVAEDGGYRFTHAMVRDALVARLDPARRRGVHLLIGRRLATRAATDRSFVAARAAHLTRAGSSVDVRRELAAAAAEAAREADRSLAFEDAARWWSVGVESVQRSGGDDAEIAEAMIEQATAQYRAGHVGDSLVTCRSAAALATGLRRADLLARTAVVIQAVDAPDVILAVGRWSEQALALAEQSPDAALDDALLAQVLAQLARVQADTGHTDRAEVTSSRSLELARRTGDPVALLGAVHARAIISHTPHGLPELLSLGQIAVSQAEQVARPIAAVLGHNWRSDAAYVLGNLDAAAAEMNAVGRIAHTYRLPLARWHHLRMRATRSALEGRIDEALAHSEEAFEVGSQLGDQSAAGMSGAFWCILAMLTERPELIEGGRYEGVRRSAPPMPIMHANNAMIFHLRGEPETAAGFWRTIRAMLFNPPDDRRWLGVLMYAIELVAPMHDPEAAAEVLRQLQPWEPFPCALSTSTTGFRGSFSRDLGRLHAVAGNTAKAEQLMRAGIDANIRFGARPFVVRGRLELAQLLGTGADAADLARLAAREARQLNMPGPLRQADELLAAIARAAPDPLTAREREIAALVGRSMSNREIANQLVLSERTVESHVRNILAKLGFTRRTEITAWNVTPR
jgi:DNA-binding CsgD family transcriptional regulator